jgi:hypothetical protein
MALGGWAWGAVAEAWGLPAAFEGAAALMIVGIGVMWTTGMPGLGAEHRPARVDEDGPVAPPTDPGDNAILVLIEYRVAEGDAFAFLRAMNGKRRIRLRDGARRWSLSQDAFERERWIEQYVSGSWSDYHRQRFRPTLADGAVEKQVLGFHRGDGPPQVRRLVFRRSARACADGFAGNAEADAGSVSFFGQSLRSGR